MLSLPVGSARGLGRRIGGSFIMDRTLQRLLARTGAVLTAAALVTIPAGSARASTFTVDCGSLTVLQFWGAILEANDESTHPGQDTISLSPHCTYTIGGPYPGTDYALPAITSAIEIVGNGATIEYHSTADASGLFDIAPGAGLTLTGANLLNDQGFDDGSYFHNAGDVLVHDTSVDGRGYFLGGPAVVNEAGANLTFLDVSMQDIRALIGNTNGLVQNAGSFYVVDSVLADLNEIHGLQGGVRPLGPAYDNSGYLEVVNSTLRSTIVFNGDAQYTQGIRNSGEVVIRGSNLSGFSYRSGAAVTNNGTLTVESSSFYGNRAVETPGTGAAVLNNGTASLLNTTFSSNIAYGEGAGVYNNGTATFTSVTVLAAEDSVNVGAASFTVQASILGACEGTFVDGGSNIAYPARGCPGTAVDANLVPTSSAGGQSVLYRPGPGSPAIDVVTGNCPATDARGVARPAGAACDVGAYENRPPAAPSSLTLASGSTDPGNGATLGLDWSDAVDLDQDPLTYRVFARDVDDATYTQVGSSTTSSITLTSLAEGTYDFKVDASDGNATSSATQLNDVAVDLTAPTNPTASPDRAPDYVAPNQTQWWADQLDVSFSGSTDPALADGSAGSGVAGYTATQHLTGGVHTISGTATDAAGNVSGSTGGTYRVDATAPTISFATCPSTVTLRSSVQLAWSAADGESGLASPASGSVNVDTSTIGQRVLATTATDHVGHQNTATCTTTVIYAFTGYFNPVGASFNKASAGKVVPVAFSLAGNQGVNIFAAGYPVSTPIPCQSTALLTTGEPTTATTSLTYAGGRYTYMWRTQRSWAGTCRQFVMKLDDGTFHRANFSFK